MPAAPCVRPPPPLKTTCTVLTRFTSPRVVALTRRHAEYVAGFPQWVAVWGIPPAVGDAVRLVVGVINACLLGWLAFAPFPESRVGACTVRLSCVLKALCCSVTFASDRRLVATARCTWTHAILRTSSHSVHGVHASMCMLRRAGHRGGALADAVLDADCRNRGWDRPATHYHGD
jgi:hypothetical protein